MKRSILSGRSHYDALLMQFLLYRRCTLDIIHDRVDILACAVLTRERAGNDTRRNIAIAFPISPSRPISILLTNDQSSLLINPVDQMKAGPLSYGMSLWHEARRNISLDKLKKVLIAL